MDDGRRRLLRDWGAVLAVGVAAGALLSLLGLPSPALFGGLAAGLGRALLGRRRLVLPRPAGLGAQAVIGVSIGALMQTDTLAAIAEHWLPVLLVTVGKATIASRQRTSLALTKTGRAAFAAHVAELKRITGG